MNNNRYNLVWRTGQMFDFLVHSTSRYGVHSPFLYNLIQDVIRNRVMPPELVPVETLRRECFEDKEVIQKTDFGRGSLHRESQFYPISISRIARTSLMPRKSALRLFYLARHQGSKRILELGTSLGITTAYLAIADPLARIVSIEGCPDLCSRAKSNLQTLGQDNVEVLEGRFEDRLGDALSALGGIDLLVVDGDHRKEAVIGNLERCRPFFHNDSVIVLDDIYYSHDMKMAWDILCTWGEVRISLDLFFMGWLFFRKESFKEHFRLRYL